MNGASEGGRADGLFGPMDQETPRTRRGAFEPTGPGSQFNAGIVCPQCGCSRSRVYYMRRRLGRIFRVRICDHCGKRYQTIERER